ncbi:22033_t:CDS:2, partial [Gigaspora margarita]
DPNICEELKQSWKNLIESKEEKDSEDVKKLWAGIWHSINHKYLLVSSSSNTTKSTSSSHSRKRKFTNKDESEDEKKEKMVNKNPWILKNQTRVMEKITKFFEKDSYVNQLAFNHPLLSGVIDLDIIDKIMMNIFLPEELSEMAKCDKIISWKAVDEEMKKWIADFVKTENIQPKISDCLDPEECTYVQDMYIQLQQGDGEILEDTYVHEIMHNIMYYTIRDLCPSKVRIAWGTRTPEEGNGRVEQNYDVMFLKMSLSAKKTYRDKFQSRNRPGWLATYNIYDRKYEFLYGEAAGPPFLSTVFKSEGDRRKVIGFLLRCNESLDKLLKEHFPSNIDEDLITSAKCIPRFGMILYGTFLKIIYYDNSNEIDRVLPFLNIKLPLQSNSDQFSTTNYLYGLIMFRRAAKETLKSFGDLKNIIPPSKLSRVNKIDIKQIIENNIEDFVLEKLREIVVLPLHQLITPSKNQQNRKTIPRSQNMAKNWSEENNEVKQLYQLMADCAKEVHNTRSQDPGVAP